MYTLNTFRAIQRRLTLELREMGSRDRVLGDVHFIRPMEKAGDGGGAGRDDDAKTRVTTASQENTEESMRSGKRAGLRAKGDVDGGGEEPGTAETKEGLDIVNDPLIDINQYRYNNRFVNYLNSTCPIVPKFHATFGQPIER